MKTFKAVGALFNSLFFIAIFAFAITVSTGISPIVALSIMATLTLIGSLLKNGLPKGIAMAGIYKEVWTGEVINKIKEGERTGWVQAITKDYSSGVTAVGEEAEVVHLATFNIEPDVLIDNSIYPIPEQDLPFQDVPLSLHKFQTKVVPITRDEVYAATVSKMQQTSLAQANAIMKNKFELGAWCICPAANTLATPYLVTTGPDDGTGRRMLTRKDLNTFKRKLAKFMDMDAADLVLVLSQEHEIDLTDDNQVFANQYYNYQIGKPTNALGFEFYGYSRNPYVNNQTLAKLAFGATPTDGLHRRCSMFFSKQRVGKATGSTEVYLAPAATSPTTQRSTISARHYHLITRTVNEAVGGIVSGTI